MDKVDKLIEIVRNIREENGVVGNSSGSPTNSANSSGLGFDPVKDSPPVFKNKKKNIYLGIGSRKRWMKPK